MNEAKKYQLQDLIERIESVDRLIKSHASNPSSFMTKQYEAKKAKLLGYLIDELVDDSHRSPYSFRLIMLALKKFYPELTKTGRGNSTKSKQYKSSKELKALENVLS